MLWAIYNIKNDVNFNTYLYVCIRFRISVLPDLFQLPSKDLQVVERPSNSEHHLGVVAGSHADVPALWLLPFTHQGLAVLEHQAHRA